MRILSQQHKRTDFRQTLNVRSYATKFNKFQLMHFNVMAEATEQDENKKGKRSHCKEIFLEYKHFFHNNNKQCEIFKFEVWMTTVYVFCLLQNGGTNRVIGSFVCILYDGNAMK